MKLKKYSTVAGKAQNGKPSISFSAKSGIVRLNKALLTSLGLKNGDKIDICQDEENVKDWYITIAKEGFTLRVSERLEGMVNSKTVCEDIRACVKNIDDEKSSKMLVAVEHPTVLEKQKYFPILTSSAH